jgi:hypothetical protein
MKTDGISPISTVTVFHFFPSILFFWDNMETGPETGRGGPGSGTKTVERLSVRIADIPFSTRISSFHPVFFSNLG